jgi:hypothetical protein
VDKSNALPEPTIAWGRLWRCRNVDDETMKRPSYRQAQMHVATASCVGQGKNLRHD